MSADRTVLPLRGVWGSMNRRKIGQVAMAGQRGCQSRSALSFDR